MMMPLAGEKKAVFTRSSIEVSHYTSKERVRMELVQTQYLEKQNVNLPLDSGKVLQDVTIAYETYGTLSPEKNNAILICHALSGNAHAAGKYSEGDKKSGWWDYMIGQGRPLDTDRFFIICSNVIGGCAGSTGPASIEPGTNRPYGMRFPFITIDDMVRAQTLLIDDLGIETLFAVIGGSMGGMQALAWANRYSERVKYCIPLATALYQSAQNIALHEVGRTSITSDPNFRNGDYYETEEQPDDGLRIARMVGHISYLSDEAMREKFGRRLQNVKTLMFDTKDLFQVESYLGYKGQVFVERFDANSYLYISRAIDYFDIGYEMSPKDILPHVKNTQFFVLSFSSDWLYPPYQCEEIVKACKASNIPVSYYTIETNAGHDSFLLRNEMMEELIKNYLANAYEREMMGRSIFVQSVEKEEWNRERLDFRHIIQEIPEKSRVLDLGCGDGYLLEKLFKLKQCKGQGVEIDRANFIACVKRGVNVIESDINSVLRHYSDNSFDYVVLNISLQVTRNTKEVMQESVRVGKKVIVSFPNFSHIGNILAILGGRMPKSNNLPFEWYETPNIHLLTIKDFRVFCEENGYDIISTYLYNEKGRTLFFPDIFAEYGMFIVQKKDEGVSS